MAASRSAGRASRRAAPRKKPGAKPEAELIKMSELSKRSGVPGPTIKHYIREGLLPGPEVRTSRNMAYYDARLVARIRVIKALQADRFLPLRVIAELLESAPSDQIRSDRDAAPRRVLTSIGVQRRKRTEVMKTFGVSRAELDSLEKCGVLELRGQGDTAGYSGIDVELLEILADVHRAGMTALFPISIAEPYLTAVKQLVELELEIFRHRALTTELPMPLDDVARAVGELGERLIVKLRAKLLPEMLARLAEA